MKQKRKEAPINLKRYWIIFGVITILLLFPIRLQGHFVSSGASSEHIDYAPINIGIYSIISIVITIAMINFIRNYVSRRNLSLLPLMIVCWFVSIYYSGNMKYIDYMSINIVIYSVIGIVITIAMINFIRSYLSGRNLALLFWVITCVFISFYYPGSPHNKFYSPINIAIYSMIGIVITIIMINFIRSYDSTKNRTLLLLMITCLSVSFHHQIIANEMTTCFNDYDHPYSETKAFDWLIFETVGCSAHILQACCVREFIGIRNTYIAIDTGWIGAIFLPREQVYFDG